MIRKLLATTAVATLLATGAYAQDATQPAPAQPPAADPAAPAAPMTKADGNLATNLIGETVYNGTGDDAENIGDVNDLVIGMDGKVASIVIGVGGFLGIAEKNVALNYSDIDWAERDGDRWIVVSATKEQLESMPAFDRNAFGPANTASDTTAPANDSTAMAPATPPAGDTTAMTPATPPAGDDTATTPTQDRAAQAPATGTDTTTGTATDTTTTGAIDRSQLKEMPTADIRSEELVGTTVYGAQEENVGEIGDVVMTQDGKIDAVIIDVGGFLGVGEKEVAVGMDNLAFMTDDSGNKYLYTNFTKEQLDAAPAYDKSTWAEKRDEQRLVITR